MSTFLLMLREGAEAALIVAIVLTYLRSVGLGRQMRWVWGGVAAAVVVASAAAAVLQATIGSLEGRSEKIVEGVVALAAAAVLTWMIMWMAGRARGLRAHLEGEVASAAASGGWALAAVGFVAVLREGLETALFLVAAGEAGGGAGRVLGGLAGLMAAAAVGFGIYQSGRRFNLRLFFRVTGLVILLFAGGLVARGVHELGEAGVLPAPADPVWHLDFGNPETSLAGRVAADVLGWTPAPSLLQVLAYWAYLIPAVLAFRRRARPRAEAWPGAGAEASSPTTLATASGD